ncbi:hypothetical protein AZ19_1859 [Bordetella bronchiseptica E012]|nr:hypothetical protein AZ19_1859 [Bordetella bronchiseptica E012]
MALACLGAAAPLAAQPAAAGAAQARELLLEVKIAGLAIDHLGTRLAFGMLALGPMLSLVGLYLLRQPLRTMNGALTGGSSRCAWTPRRRAWRSPIRRSPTSRCWRPAWAARARCC